MSEILQIEQIFTNVSKGQVAKKEDWEKAYGTSEMTKVIEEVCSRHHCACPARPFTGPDAPFSSLATQKAPLHQVRADIQILKKGELQINNLERSHALSSLSREIATLISEMTVDPTSTPPRKHTVGMVEKAMTELGYSVKVDKPAKAQALELIRKIQEAEVLPMRRSRMRIRVTMPAKDAKRIGAKVKEEGEGEEEDAGEEWEVVSSRLSLGCGGRMESRPEGVEDERWLVQPRPACEVPSEGDILMIQIMKVDPSAYKTLSDLISTETKGKGRVESMGTVNN